MWSARTTYLDPKKRLLCVLVRSTLYISSWAGGGSKFEVLHHINIAHFNSKFEVFLNHAQYMLSNVSKAIYYQYRVYAINGFFYSHIMGFSFLKVDCPQIKGFRSFTDNVFFTA